MANCSKPDCEEQGIWRPIIAFQSFRKKPGPKVRFKQIRMCESHKNTISIENLVSDEGWGKLLKHTREAGKETSTRKPTALSWEKVEITDEETVLRLTPEASRIDPKNEEELPF